MHDFINVLVSVKRFFLYPFNTCTTFYFSQYFNLSSYRTKLDLPLNNFQASTLKLDLVSAR